MGNEWKRIDLPYIFERAIAFSVPSEERIVVMSYEGLHDIRLGPPLSVSTDESHAEDYRIYDEARLAMTIDGQRYGAFGLHGGCPYPTTSDGLRVGIDVARNRVEVTDTRGDLVIGSDHNRYPPGWLVASFSQNGRLFIVGTPDEMRCWRR